MQVMARLPVPPLLYDISEYTYEHWIASADEDEILGHDGDLLVRLGSTVMVEIESLIANVCI